MKSKLSYDDLNDKTVEFRLRINESVIHGIGKFMLRQYDAGRFSVTIEVNTQGKNWAQRVVSSVSIPEDRILSIETHPDASRAEFRLFDTQSE